MLNTSISKLLTNIYLVLSLFIFAFVNFNGATVFDNFTVHYIDGHPVIIHTLFSVIVLLLFLAVAALERRGVIFDTIAKCLIIKCILDFSQVFFNDQIKIGTYFWFFASTLVSFISYMIMVNVRVSDQEIVNYKKLFIVFGIVLSLQVFYTAAYCGVDYFDIRYKTAMVIPYGGSNIIAAILVPISALIYCESYKKATKLLLLSIILLAVVLTKSRGGMILGTIVVFFLLYNSSKYKRYKILNVIVITAMITLLLIAVFTNDLTQSVILGYSIVSNNKSLDSVFSGRLSLYCSVFTNINNIFLGSGMQTITSTNLSGAHNIIIDLLSKCGILGMLNYVIMFIYMIRCGIIINRFKKNAFFAMIVIIFLNSLYEVCYFSYECDALLWMFAGLMMHDYYFKKQELISLYRFQSQKLLTKHIIKV